MKKIIIYLLVLTLLVSTLFLSGCTNQNTPTDEQDIDKQYSELVETLNAFESADDASNYLVKWANEREVPVSHDSFGNVIMSSKSTEGYEDAESTVFQCTVDLENIEQTAAEMFVASRILTHAEHHGFVRMLFTPPDGLQKLSKTYINANNFISLDCSDANAILVGSAGNDYYTMTTDLEWTSPSYTNAYQIVIEGLPQTKFNSSASRPNLITVIGDILATAKSNSILIEIAEFNGGSSRDTYPSNVTCTLLVNQKDANTVKKRISNAMDNFYNRYDVDPDTFVFTYNEVEVPDKVISYEDTARLISFLYTCLDGNYLKDDAGEVIAKANISTISTENGHFSAEVCAASKSNDVLYEMETIFETICGLSNISYTKEAGNPVWESTDETADTFYSEENVLNNESISDTNSLIQSLTAAAETVIGKIPSLVRTFDSTPCAIANKRMENMNVAAYGITPDNILEAIKVLTTYLSNSNNINE